MPAVKGSASCLWLLCSPEGCTHTISRLLTAMAACLALQGQAAWLALGHQDPSLAILLAELGLAKLVKVWSHGRRLHAV